MPLCKPPSRLSGGIVARGYEDRESEVRTEDDFRSEGGSAEGAEGQILKGDGRAYQTRDARENEGEGS